MNNNEKIILFGKLLEKHNQNGFELLKEFLIMTNPDLEQVKILQEMVQNYSVMGEYSMSEFLAKWREYVRCREKSLTEISNTVLNARFDKIMKENFGKEA